MALEFSDMVVKMVEAKQVLETAEQDTAQRLEDVRAALETLRNRTSKILDNPLEDGSFEIVFLDSMLAKVDEADRRYEVSHTLMVGAKRQADLLTEVVEGLK